MLSELEILLRDSEDVKDNEVTSGEGSGKKDNWESTNNSEQKESFEFKSTGSEKKVYRKKYRKTCWLCRQGKLTIDYKDVDFLRNYLKRYNKILIHKFSGNCLKHQHQLAQAIKRARYIALLPFVAE